MARPTTSQDGRPRVRLSTTISAKAHDFLMTTTARLKKENPQAAIGQSIDSMVDFSKVRRFDPIKLMEKKKPVKSFDTPTGNTATQR